MTREEKDALIENLQGRLESNEVIYLADTSELNVEHTNKLRKHCYDNNISLQVVKNTLLQKALERTEAKDLTELIETLEGPTSVMFAEKGNAPAKVIREFRKDFSKPLLKGAYIEEEIYKGDDKLQDLAELKSREELIGDIVGLLQSPTKNVISALRSGGNKLSGILKSLEERNQE